MRLFGAGTAAGRHGTLMVGRRLRRGVPGKGLEAQFRGSLGVVELKEGTTCPHSLLGP
jgi:hypothetical protein